MKQILIFTAKWENSLGKNDLSIENLCRYIKDPFQENAVNISGDEWNQVIPCDWETRTKTFSWAQLKTFFRQWKKKLSKTYWQIFRCKERFLIY